MKIGIISTFITPVSDSRFPSYLGICLFSRNGPDIQLLITCHFQSQCNTLYQELHFGEGEAGVKCIPANCTDCRRVIPWLNLLSDVKGGSCYLLLRRTQKNNWGEDSNSVPACQAHAQVNMHKISAADLLGECGMWGGCAGQLWEGLEGDTWTTSDGKWVSVCPFILYCWCWLCRRILPYWSDFLKAATSAVAWPPAHFCSVSTMLWLSSGSTKLTSAIAMIPRRSM